VKGIVRSLALLPLMFLLPAHAQNDKPIATQLGEAIAPISERVTNAYTETLLEFMAGGDGFVAESARSVLKQRAKPAPGTTLRPITQCLKPGNVIDEDVQACVTGTHEKTW
jgi:hypothetical protein